MTEKITPFKIFLLVFAIVFFVLAIVGGIFFSNATNNVLHTNTTIKVSTAEEFVKAIVTNSRNEEANTTITLIADIELEEEHVKALNSVHNRLGSMGAVLYCTLDGECHSVAINPSVSAPLFECVYGAIKRTSFEFEEVESEDEKKSDLCALTRVNHGKIEDVKLVVHYLVNAGEKNVGGITNYNFGTISRCIVNLRSIKTKANTSWKRFGGIATNNLEEGEVNGAIVRVSFPSNFTPLTNDDTNLCVGYAFSFWSDTSKISDVFVVKEKEGYFEKSCNPSGVEEREKTNLKNSDWDGWTFDSVNETTPFDDCLPYLKKKGGE